MFAPWLGERFGDSDNQIKGLRLLIVGESHYPSEANRHLIGQTSSQCTKEIISDYAVKEPYKFFNEIAKLVSGQDQTSWTYHQRQDFWSSVAFYNFVPVFIAPPIDRKRPKMSEWKAGKDPFKQVFGAIKPSVVLVCGLDLWWWVMDSLPGGAAENDPARNMAEFGSAKFLRIPHPSSQGKSRYHYNEYRPKYDIYFK